MGHAAILSVTREDIELRRSRQQCMMPKQHHSMVRKSYLCTIPQNGRLVSRPYLSCELNPLEERFIAKESASIVKQITQVEGKLACGRERIHVVI